MKNLIQLYRKFFGCITIYHFFDNLKTFLRERFKQNIEIYLFNNGVFKNIETDLSVNNNQITTNLLMARKIKHGDKIYIPLLWKGTRCWEVKKCYNRSCEIWNTSKICWITKLSDRCYHCDCFSFVGAVSMNINSFKDFIDELKLRVMLSDLQEVIKGIYYYKKIHYRAFHDSLTGLLNRTAFFNEVSSILDNNKILYKPGTIVMCDIDKFKSYNDTFGHVEGDKLLKTFSDVLQSSVRKSNDLVGRYGGEEFIIFLNCDKFNSIRVLQKIKNEVSLHCSYLRTVTASFGLASYPDDAYTLEELIEIADKALYNSKEKGRNRISYYVKGKMLCVEDNADFLPNSIGRFTV